MPEPPPERSVSNMPPMSILAAPLPPQPGSVPEAPAPPGAIPRLSLATPGDKPPVPKVPPSRLGDSIPKIGGKPMTVKPGKTASVLRKRPALSRTAKVGLSVGVIAVGVVGFSSYRIFFPVQTPDMRIKRSVIAQPGLAGDVNQAATNAISKGASAPGDLTKKGQGAIDSERVQKAAKVDAPASGGDVPAATPTPIPTSAITESVLGQSSISNDVTVGNMPIDAAPEASAAFRSFVANAEIGGVYQGSPSRAFINGTVVREGQVLDSALGIAFERIDSSRKIIYFRDYTGAEVSKNY